MIKYKHLGLIGSGLATSLIALTANLAGGSSGTAAVPQEDLVGWSACTISTAKAAFRDQADVRVTAVRLFNRAEKIPVRGSSTAPIATHALCMVKLLIGPGNPGPAGAPSTLDGISVEVWLPEPSRWNGRIHNVGGGGFMGPATIRAPDQVYSGGGISPYEVADEEGAVSAVTDTGHVGGDDPFASMMNGAFLMLPDGGINRRGWQDFAQRSTHEMTVATKTLTRAFYGRAQEHAYFDGCSTGGRQAHKEAQVFPEDYDGILAGAPAIHWSRFISAELYPQIRMQRELGGPISLAKLERASAAAVSACDTDLTGKHAGFISDPGKCGYDPSNDRGLLCRADGGTGDGSTCMTKREAAVLNGIWYGQTRDGSVPDPITDAGWSEQLGGQRMWFGPLRGTQLQALAGSENGSATVFPIAAQQVAFNLGNPAIANVGFRNAKADGAEGWKRLGYADLARSEQQGRILQGAFSDIDTDNPDLSRFRARGGRMIVYHGMADQLIPIQGTTRYWNALGKRAGGPEAVRGFYRYYQIPGMGHCEGVGSVNGTKGESPPADPPLPSKGQLYQALVAWVETRSEPTSLVLHNATATLTRPLCEFPRKLRYRGGDPSIASSFVCR